MFQKHFSREGFSSEFMPHNVSIVHRHIWREIKRPTMIRERSVSFIA